MRRVSKSRPKRVARTRKTPPPTDSPGDSDSEPFRKRAATSRNLSDPSDGDVPHPSVDDNMENDSQNEDFQEDVHLVPEVTEAGNEFESAVERGEETENSIGKKGLTSDCFFKT